MSPEIAQRIADILLVIVSLYAPVESTGRLSSLDPSTQTQFVSRAMGEARGDGDEAVSMVIGTMLCRLEEGYGTPEQLLAAYYAPDYPVSAPLVESFGSATCEGYKYALSATLDIPRLGIPEDEPRKCVGDTCFFKRWVSNK